MHTSEKQYVGGETAESPESGGRRRGRPPGVTVGRKAVGTRGGATHAANSRAKWLDTGVGPGVCFCYDPSKFHWFQSAYRNSPISQCGRGTLLACFALLRKQFRRDAASYSIFLGFCAEAIESARRDNSKLHTSARVIVSRVLLGSTVAASRRRRCLRQPQKVRPPSDIIDEAVIAWRATTLRILRAALVAESLSEQRKKKTGGG